MIYCTDGYGEAPKSNPIGIPVMWVITKGGTEDFVNWGEKLKLNFTDTDVK
jgi:predicted metal-dependent peptidase